MLRTGMVIDTRYQEHNTGPSHPERAERIGALLRLDQEYQREGLVRLTPRPASADEIAYNHDLSHIGRVAATAQRDFYAFDADTPTSAQSFATACLAAGGLLTLLETIMTGEVDNGFALVRPPGHHAERGRAMGFCLFNNVAIGARYLQNKFALNRVLIMDWDLHHGNGTQRSFYQDKNVLYLSTHQYPYYPGTGAAEEVGAGEGEGFTVNLPFPAGWGDAEYTEAFQRVIAPICRQFNPQFVLISAGFDCHYRDPLGGMNVTEEGFAAMARTLLRIARDHGQGRCAAILEGGYDLTALTNSVMRVLDEMGGNKISQDIPQREGFLRIFPRLKEIHKRHWEL
jgi:acetoin utilization deacetylase AcuC-like enzyme